MALGRFLGRSNPPFASISQKEDRENNNWVLTISFVLKTSVYSTQMMIRITVTYKTVIIIILRFKKMLYVFRYLLRTQVIKMRHKPLQVDNIANINNLKKMYRQICWKIPFACINNLNVKFLITNNLGPNVLNRVHWLLY